MFVQCRTCGGDGGDVCGCAVCPTCRGAGQVPDGAPIQALLVKPEISWREAARMVESGHDAGVLSQLYRIAVPIDLVVDFVASSRKGRRAMNRRRIVVQAA